MTDELEFPDERGANAWDAYTAKEISGSREEKLTTLETFIAEMARAALEKRRRFVESWCEAYLDGKAVSPLTVRNGEWMRLPLFRSLFGPILEDGRKEGRGNYARWSAQLHGLFCRPGSAYRLYEPARDTMLFDALRIDPGDGRARSLLIMSFLSDMDYFCHELPSGLLVEPDSLIELISEVEKLLSETIWAKHCQCGLAALRRIAAGDWSDKVLDDASDLFELRFRIAEVLFPKTQGSTFA